MSPSTEYIWGLRAMEKCWTKDYADWALEMLVSGVDSKCLRILAGLETNSSVFEAEDYFQRAVRELSLVQPSREGAIKAYSLYVANQIIKRDVPARVGVKKLFRLCTECDYPSYLMIWFNLDDACDDVAYGNWPYTYPDLTMDNLEETVIKEARAFVEGRSGSSTE